MKRIVLASLVLSFSLSANANQLSIDDQINNACAKALSGDKEPLGNFPPDRYAATVSPKVKEAYNEVLKSRPSIVKRSEFTECNQLRQPRLEIN